MKKLQATTKDATERFDETLRKLFEKKLKCEMAIYQVSQHRYKHTNTHIHTHTINICERQTHNMDFITRPYFTGRAQDYLSCLFSPNRRGDEKSRSGPQAQTWKDGGTQGQTHLNTSNGEVISYLTEWNGTGVLTNFCRKIFQTLRCALQEFCATRLFCSGFKAASQFLNLSTYFSDRRKVVRRWRDMKKK